MHPAFRNLEPSTNDQVTAYFDAVGRSDARFLDVTSDAVAKGTPLFPSGGERYRTVRTPYSLIIASEGLADYGAEVYIEMMHGQGWMYEQVRRTWQRWVVAGAAHLANRRQGLPMEDLPVVFSVEAPRGTPGHLINPGTGAVAVMVGIPVPGRPSHTDDGSVALVALTPITPQEFQVIEHEGPAGAQRVAQNRADLKFHHTVVDAPEVAEQILAALNP